MKTFIILITVLLLSANAQQNSQAYTQAYLEELQKSKDLFLAQEAGRAADKKIPKNIFTQIFNIKKFQGNKKISLGKYFTSCTTDVTFKTAVKGKNKVNLYALCSKKINKDTYLLYQGYSTSQSKRIEFILNSILISKKHMFFWFNHFNVHKTNREYLLK